MRLGVLDIGSHYAQLQVVEVRSGAPPLPSQAFKAATLLGDAVLPDGSIGGCGMDRIVDAVKAALWAAEQCCVEQMYVFGTAAVRDATNRDRIVARLERKRGSARSS